MKCFVDHLKIRDVKFVSAWLILIVLSQQRPNGHNLEDPKI